MLKPKRFAIMGGVLIAAVGFIMGGLYLIRQAEEEITVVVPELSPEATTGRAAFETYCVECHGNNAAGTVKGPPLVHPIYRPAHHGDFSFVRFVALASLLRIPRLGEGKWASRKETAEIGMGGLKTG